MKKFISIILVGFVTISSFAVTKTKMKVLYVGGSANFDTSQVKKSAEEVSKSVNERTADFTALLKQYFTTVKAVQGKDYSPAMSAKYDVTIFDGLPKAIRERNDVTDEKGRIVKVNKALYLPYDFSDACVCIGEISEHMGRPLGTKNDWYCLCLDAEAHSYNAEHPIFKGPYKVNYKPVMKPVPAYAIEYKNYSPAYCPDSVLMFPVQTTGYMEVARKKEEMLVRIGMVCRPGGYNDSPDAEAISSGVCAKSIDAVAIGRHGNFFHWGFATPPAQLTEAGKVLFINSVAYAAKFKGQTPIARKMDDRVITREEWKMGWRSMSEESYKDFYNQEKSYQDRQIRMRDSLKKVVADGGKIDERVAFLLNYQPRKIASRMEFARQRGGELFKFFGSNAELYKSYYEYNAPYLAYNWQRGGVFIDEDARDLGIANNDIAILDKAISMLESNTDAAKAKRILERYTLARFATTKEWREWLETYRDRMFFTENGGYVWLVNSRDASVPGNDYSVRTGTEAIKEQIAEVAETDDRNPVALSANMIVGSDGQKEIVVRMKVHKGYHTYCNVVDEDPFIPTKINIVLPKGYEKVGTMIYPATHLEPTGTTSFEGDCLFRQKVRGNATGKATVVVKYQCCNKDICMPPTEKTLEVTLK